MQLWNDPKHPNPKNKTTDSLIKFGQYVGHHRLKNNCLKSIGAELLQSYDVIGCILNFRGGQSWDKP